MRLGRQGRVSAWVSLFAVLMMFIGPLISQAMPMTHGMAAATGGSMPPHPGIVMAQPHCQPAAAHGSDSKLHPMWERCGYCSLFFHCPALPQSLQLRADTSPLGTLRLLVQARQGHGVQPIFPGARTRAPPLPALV
jgi:hypothetical protein